MNTIDFMNKLNYQLDLAKEAHDYLRGDTQSEIPGVTEEVEKRDNISISTIKIINDQGVDIMKKPKGTYITVDAPEIANNKEQYEKLGLVLSDILNPLIKQDDNKPILVVGLGNIDAIPDALGPMVIEKSLATRHILVNYPDMLPKGFSKVALLNTSVLGRTGIESYEIIKGVVDEIKPSCIVVIDSLVAASISRIATSFQITNTGVKPGSGIGNNRTNINEETLGIPCIAIGVPFMVYGEIIVKEALTLLKNYLIEVKEPASVTDKINPDMALAIMKSLLGEENGHIAVTPKDINMLIVECANVINMGLSFALHKYLNINNYNEFITK